MTEENNNSLDYLKSLLFSASGKRGKLCAKDRNEKAFIEESHKMGHATKKKKKEKRKPFFFS